MSRVYQVYKSYFEFKIEHPWDNVSDFDIYFRATMNDNPELLFCSESKEAAIDFLHEQEPSTRRFWHHGRPYLYGYVFYVEHNLLDEDGEFVELLDVEEIKAEPWAPQEEPEE